MFEYQTAISELTGLPVSNASVYEGPSALAAAGYLAKLHQPARTRFLVSRGVHPHSRETLASTSVGWGTTIEEIPLADGATDARGARATRSATTSPRSSCSTRTSSAPSRTSRRSCPPPRRPARSSIVQCDPIPLGILRPPGDFGVDVAVGEGQPLGNRLDFGGPSFGFFAAQEAYLRRMPGRIAGETTDVDGRRGFVLTLQTREQHIRREKATHNICTAQALNALAGVIYLSWLGPRRAWSSSASCCCSAPPTRATRSPALDGVELLHEQPVVREFAVTLDADVDAVIERCAARGRQPRLPARPRLPRVRRTACWWRSPSSATRPTSTAWPRTLAGRRARGGARVTTSPRPPSSATARARSTRSRSPAGARSSRPSSTCRSRDDLLPERFRRTEPARLPEIAEPEIVRHYNRLSKRNFDLDTGFYPLGSCTMKHNPKLHERVAALPGNARLHPLQHPRARAGRAAADVGAAARRWARSPGSRTSRCSRAPARTASWPACCSRAPTTRTAASSARRCSRPTPRTAPTRRR